MADAVDSKSIGRKAVWVRLPPPAPDQKAMDVGASGDASAGPTFVVMCLLFSSRWLARRRSERVRKSRSHMTLAVAWAISWSLSALRPHL